MKVTSAEKKNSGSRGFTLIEVAVAVALLGASLTTLIGFQTRLIDNYVAERNMLRATMAAQYLITFVEVESDPPEPGKIEGDLIDALRDKGYFDGDSLDGFDKTFAGWTYKIETTSVDYAEFTDILRRIEISVIWDGGARDRVSLVMFVNTPILSQLPGK